MSEVIKRKGNVVKYDKANIVGAISRANKETKEMLESDVQAVAEKVNEWALGLGEPVHVEDIQDKVEEELMLSKHTKTAKAYILYRDEQNKLRRRDIFKPRKNLKPYEYPELEEYVTAIRSSYWVHTEYNYTSDMQNFHVEIEPHERNAIKSALLAISQVEVEVKEFWGDMYKRLPKPELSNVGATFAESEARHSDAYSHLLELLGLNQEFENIENIEALNNRVDYLKKHNQYTTTGSDRDYAISILIFSAFIEHISLFSQFLIIMSFNKYKNLFSGVSNVIEATSKEENLHGQFGIELVNTIKEENPDWFDDRMAEEIYTISKQVYESELEVIEWIFEDGEIDFLSIYTIQEFIKNRLNNSLANIGLERIFEVDEKEVEKTLWFDEEILSSKHTDFFNKRNIAYTKRSQSYDAEDLF